MKTALAALLVAGALGVAGLETSLAAPAAHGTTVADAAQLQKTCRGSYSSHASVRRKPACLAAGPSCATANKVLLRQYGLACKRGKDGRYRLHRE
jgi:hypothetical protein